MKKNRLKIIISSIIIFIPSLVGAILWNKLPESMAIHWGADGQADGFGGKGIAVFILPLIFLALHLLCVFITLKDRKNKDQNPKIIGMTFWIIPVISLFACATVYMGAFGRSLDMQMLLFPIIGLSLILIGNYMPKCKQNNTIGIKIKWTLIDEENWNKTHRFSGKLWVAGGAVMVLGAFLPSTLIPWMMIAVIGFIAIPPFVYSYAYYKKQVKAGKEFPKGIIGGIPSKKYRAITAVGVSAGIVILLAAVFFVCFTGDIEPIYGNESFTLEASYFNDITVAYSDIDSIELRENFDMGSRSYGFGSPRLSMGRFVNKEFGGYTLCAYTKNKTVIVIRSGEMVLVCGLKDGAATEKMYQEIKGRLG